MLGVHWFSASRDVAYLIRLQNSQEHVIEVSYDIIGPKLLSSLLARAIVVVDF